MSEKDELYLNAVKIVKTEGKASTSFFKETSDSITERPNNRYDGRNGLVSKVNHVGKREILK